MLNRTHFITLAVGILAVFSFGAVPTTQAEPFKTTVAVFSEEDAQFAETITLYSNGKYQQAETDKKAKLYHAYPSQHPFSQEVLPLPREELSPLLFGGSKRSGTWRVLDKGGQPIAFKTLASLPKDAAIEVKRNYAVRHHLGAPASLFLARRPNTAGQFFPSRTSRQHKKALP